MQISHDLLNHFSTMYCHNHSFAIARQKANSVWYLKAHARNKKKKKRKLGPRHIISKYGYSGYFSRRLMPPSAIRTVSYFSSKPVTPSPQSEIGQRNSKKGL